MAHISSTTPLFTLRIRDPQEQRYYYDVMRRGRSPHIYDWRTLLADQAYQQGFISRQCFTEDEASVIEAHVQMLGCHSERKPVSLPTQYGPSDTCGNMQYRDFWEEGDVPCAITYVGYFGVETELVKGLLPDDYYRHGQDDHRRW